MTGILQEMATTVSRQEIVDFLYEESELLDEWKLVEWADLFSEDGKYLVPH